MINYVLIKLVRFLLSLRYRVRIHGLEQIRQQGQRGILFLPNHPALIDPIIVMSQLYGPFRPRALADEVQIDRFLIRQLAERIHVLPIPDIGRSGTMVAGQVRDMIDRCVTTLKDNDNLLLYPAGRVYRKNREDIRGNSAVERIISQVPEIRIVLVRTRGLWGSSFSWASGSAPSVSGALWLGVRSLFLSVLFFAPRRDVDIEFVEPDDFPRAADRNTINTYLETFYNAKPQPNTYVPYTVWERGGIRTLPEPAGVHVEGDSCLIPAATRRLVRDYLSDLTGVDSFSDDALLAQDLGMDSLAGADLLIWLQSEFGFASVDIDSVRTVGDVMLAACGEAVSVAAQELKTVPASWFDSLSEPARPENLNDMTITQAFLYQARRCPDAVIVADQNVGVRTWRDVVLAVLILREKIAPLPGEHIGIMMPASVVANILYLAVLFSGKTPVMVNWTLGRKTLLHCVDSLHVKHILTSRQLVKQLESQDVDLGDISSRLLCLEDMRAGMTWLDKLRAYLRSRLCWSRLRRAEVLPTAAILFTSGSESTPKAVPLSHRNILTNVSDAYECFTVTGSDSIFGILPPFHAFGLTVSIVLPMTLGIRAVYYPNPTQGRMLGQMIDAYKVSILVGTPTFLSGVVRTSGTEQLASLRLVVSGAEKCPSRVYEMLARRCPHTEVLEGYGVTECSPVVSVNHEGASCAGTIGRVMSSLHYAIVDENSQQAVETGKTGMLLVRGPSVFDGYLNYEGPSPFVTFADTSWYRTGDLVWEDDGHVLTFGGRLKRFIKLGGEMVSLPAIEAVLESLCAGDEDEGPVLAVTATDDDRPEIVLFATKALERSDANAHIRAAGLSALHNIRQVIQVDQLPLLGTGKVDYRALAKKSKGLHGHS